MGISLEGGGGVFAFFSSFFGCDFNPFFKGVIIFLMVTGEEGLTDSILLFSELPFKGSERRGREGSGEGAGNCGEEGGIKRGEDFVGGDPEQDRRRFLPRSGELRLREVK